MRAKTGMGGAECAYQVRTSPVLRTSGRLPTDSICLFLTDSFIGELPWWYQSCHVTRDKMSTDASQLPACAKCRVRKVRCDRQAPKCGNCTKGNVACIIVDVVTGEQYAREYIQQLENEEARLKAQAGYKASRNGSGPQQTGPADSTPRGPPTAETIASHSGFVGDGSGLG